MSDDNKRKLSILNANIITPKRANQKMKNTKAEKDKGGTTLTYRPIYEEYIG